MHKDDANPVTTTVVPRSMVRFPSAVINKREDAPFHTPDSGRFVYLNLMSVVIERSDF